MYFYIKGTIVKVSMSSTNNNNKNYFILTCESKKNIRAFLIKPWDSAEKKTGNAVENEPRKKYNESLFKMDFYFHISFFHRVNKKKEKLNAVLQKNSSNTQNLIVSEFMFFACFRRIVQPLFCLNVFFLLPFCRLLHYFLVFSLS